VVQVEQSVWCVCVCPNDNFELNDLWPRYLARWFILTLSASNWRSRSQVKVQGGKMLLVWLRMQVTGWNIHSKLPNDSTNGTHITSLSQFKTHNYWLVICAKVLRATSSQGFLVTYDTELTLLFQKDNHCRRKTTVTAIARTIIINHHGIHLRE